MICGWAAGDVNVALADERGAWPEGTPVRVIGGQHRGHLGAVRCPAWEFDDENQRVNDGGPVG